MHEDIANGKMCYWSKKGVLDQVNGDEVPSVQCCRTNCGHRLRTRERCSGCECRVTLVEKERI
jgi:hypothetical protein